MKKKRIYALMAVFVLCGCIFAFYLVLNKKPYTTYHGYKIYQEAYQLARTKHKAEVSRIFYEMDGVDSSDNNLLSKNNQGKSQEDLLHEKAVKECIKNQIMIELGQEYELITFSDFQSLKRDLKTTNREREKTHKSGGVIYGPVTYSISDYMDYITGTLSTKLPELMEATYFPVTDETLTEFYQSHKESLFTTAPEINLSLLEENFSTADDAAAFEAQVAQSLSTETWAELVAHYGKGLEPTEVLIKENSITHSRYAAVYEKAISLKPQEVGVLLAGNDVSLFQVVGKNAAKEIDFNEAKNFIKALYLEDKFSEYITRKIENLTS